MEDKLKAQLIEKYPYRLELHAHTSPASSCGDVPVEEWTEIFAKDGYSGLAMTNHLNLHTIEKLGGDKVYLDFIFSEYEKAKEIAAKYNMKIYLGAELRFDNENDNDYLLYGIDRDIMKSAMESLGGTLETFAKNYKSEKSVLIHAHPFRKGLVHENTDFVDGIEAFNMHPNHNSGTAFSTKWADDNNKFKTIGTDYHHYGHDNICATRSSFLPEDSFGVVKMYRESAYIFEVGNSIILP